MINNLHTIHYIKNTKTSKTDKCNICGNISQLSWDHIPPKGSIFFDSVEINSIFTKNANWRGKSILSQNGTKFRTICSDCNNKLGAYYDIAYNDLIMKASFLISEYIEKKDEIEIECVPNKVFKSIVGHMLAAKIDYEETTHDEIMRRLIASKDRVESQINIFYWFYPFSEIEIVRDFWRGDFFDKDSGDFYSVLKSYPIGFYLTQKAELEGLNKLNDFMTDNDDDIIKIPLSISKIRHPDWPNIVSEGMFLMGGDSNKSAVVSKPK